MSNDRELLFSVSKKDLKIETFRAGGKGGSNQNKTSTGVRVRHPDSGAVAECRETRSQLENKRIAWMRLRQTPEFKRWLRRRIAEAMVTDDQRRRRQDSINEAVTRQMRRDNITIQIRGDDDEWITVDEIEEETE